MVRQRASFFDPERERDASAAAYIHAPGLHAAARRARHQGLLQARPRARPSRPAAGHGATAPRHRRGDQGAGARREDVIQAEARIGGAAATGGGGGDARRRRRGVPAARPAGARAGPRPGGALAGVARRDGVRVRPAQGPVLRGRAVGAPPAAQVGPRARRRGAQGVGGGAPGRQGGRPRERDAADTPQELGRLAGLRVPALLLLDRLPLAPQGGSRPRAILRRRRRAHAYHRPRRAADGHGGRVVPGARVRRVLVPRAGVQPRGSTNPPPLTVINTRLSTLSNCLLNNTGRMCLLFLAGRARRVRALVLRRAPPLPPAN